MYWEGITNKMPYMFRYLDNVLLFKVACWDDFFDSVFSSSLLSFHNLTYTTYILSERSSDEKYIKQHKGTQGVRCLG